MRAHQLVSTLERRHHARLHRQARRFSICGDDADDAVQRTFELALTRAPATIDDDGALRWAMVVTRREALRIRRLRERLLTPAPAPGGQAKVVEPEAERLVCRRPGPYERAERRDAIAAAALVLAQLRPAERRAIGLQAAGLSYAEIRAVTGWSYTKVNRCLAEGRAQLRGEILGAMSEENAKIAERWIKAYNDRDLETLKEIADPEIEIRLASGAEFSGHNGLDGWTKHGWEGDLPHYPKVDQYVPNGDLVSAVLHVDLRSPETGETVRTISVDVEWKFRDGRIVALNARPSGE